MGHIIYYSLNFNNYSSTTSQWKRTNVNFPESTSTTYPAKPSCSDPSLLTRRRRPQPGPIPIQPPGRAGTDRRSKEKPNDRRSFSTTWRIKNRLRRVRWTTGRGWEMPLPGCTGALSPSWTKIHFSLTP